MIRYIAIFICIVSGYFANAGTIDPLADDASHLKYGAEHECVVRIDGKTINDEPYWGSAVVIKPQWILTAAHVVNNTKNQHIMFDGSKINIISIFKPDQFDVKSIGKNDIALCLVDKNITLDYYPELYENDDEVGKLCSQAGFGSSGTFVTGSIKSDGKKRAGSNVIDAIDQDMLVCSVLSDKKTSMEFLISHGDSGGGLFIDQKLAGIHSVIWNTNGITPKATYSTKSGHTRISIFKNWINNIIKKY